ncbi:4-hydroxybenzoate polyprenyltransferase-like prenyltransferase [Aequorivita sublithincola DSM 14238]|uniref:4-hydroxybenzoate polyprenyltransferase-like prenyltransferase n=1 Tax=Aequorivita sublithincola (strain DSM 14238 / LMG 21431 / ACAM 643 / 9-3) TaxID=746697 RepID=I3YZK7_AEQSU|nr:geranylgeranylglycerol-phosphate geranylgeranyltransferase [Aequorivita sublithincola]AFL82425.1 4-hydroxybenzoate polyprenyltransferase-like prenyltransferase [Aequorivita sublithincola DSM 14238]
MNYLNLIRYQNLLFITLVQIFIKYGLFPAFGVDSTLNTFSFTLLVIATLCIAAAGNIINDIYDVEIDKINKPTKVLIGKKVSESNANPLYIILNVVGVAIGFYLSNSIGKSGFSALFVVFSALLYLYASYLKGMFLVGNLLVSGLVAMSLIIVPLFDLLPAITLENQAVQSAVFKIVLYYALFAFSINFIREIVKDLQDINGDKKGGMNTLAIALGRKRTMKIVFTLAVIMILGIVIYMYEFLYNQQILMLYFLFAIVAPLLYFCVKAWDAETPKQYKLLSMLLKIIMFLGICSIPLYLITIY